MAAVLLIVGAALVVTGISLIFVPAGFIAAGLCLGGAGFDLVRSPHVEPPQ